MSAARIPWAIWEPITGRSRLGNKPVRMTVHITAVRATDIYGPNKGPGGTYAHCHNSRNGQFRQHQELNRMSQADLDGNGETVSIENEGREGDPLTEAQIDNLARAFAHCVLELGVPNRIATVDDTRGLAWHRLGVSGNFGVYKASDMTTWSAAQTGRRWTKARGKTCPTNNVIRQIPEIYRRAQEYIGGKGSAPAPIPDLGGLIMATVSEIAYAVNAYKNERQDKRDVYGITLDTDKNVAKLLAAVEKLTAAVERLPYHVWAYTNPNVTDRSTYYHVLTASAVLDAIKDIPGVDADAIAQQVADRVVHIEAADVADEVAGQLTVTTKED